MRVLLSAYACEPGLGSEPGVGWRWAHEIARRGHEVTVLTRAANRARIEAAGAGDGNPRFVYFDLPRWARWWKRGGRGIRLYYTLWQWGAYRRARALHRARPFDMVHHLTLTAFRHPSFMGGLGIPFVLGPLGGGERAPFRLRRGLGPRGFAVDLLRDAANLAARLDPMLRRCLDQANAIYVKTEETRRALPRRHRARARIAAEIGVDPAAVRTPKAAPAPANGLRLLFVGRFVSWKGGHLAIAALARLIAADPGARLTMVGRGAAGARWRRLARRLGVADRIAWRDWTARDRLAEIYRAHDVFLFPSLHDSGGSVVLEALAAGLPVVCLDLGGPPMFVDDRCGRVIATAGRDADAVAGALAAALVEIAAAPALRRALSAGAIARARQRQWADVVAEVYGEPAWA